ncbi:MAG: DUF924 family protein [Gammaproteobacteria bacterium]|nr:MAG: DUF924 family protein [Gammaproteobacteria bacterium]
MNIHVVTPEQLLEFWFSERVRKLWFRSTPEFDQEITNRFEATWQAAGEGKLSDWEDTPEGALALVIVLDQLPLNMYRGQAISFSTEAASRDVASRAIERGFDVQLTDDRKAFLYTSFMHSEHISDQNRSVELYRQAGLMDGLKWARHHRKIVQQFGRFPHRNAILGRENTEQETSYLNSSDAFLG